MVSEVSCMLFLFCFFNPNIILAKEVEVGMFSIKKVKQTNVYIISVNQKANRNCGYLCIFLYYFVR